MGFMREKDYSCSRICEILALAMERKMYDSFMSVLPRERNGDIKSLLVDVPEDANAHEQFHNNNSLLQDHKNQYKLFFKDVIDGKLGPNALY